MLLGELVVVMAVVLLDVVVAVDQVLALVHNIRSAFADSLRRKLAPRCRVAAFDGLSASGNLAVLPRAAR